MRIRNELTAIAPLDATEREHLADALGWVDSGAELFRVAKPATPPEGFGILLRCGCDPKPKPLRAFRPPPPRGGQCVHCRNSASQGRAARYLPPSPRPP